MNNITETNAIKTPEGLLFKTKEHYFKMELSAQKDGYYDIEIGYAHDDWEAYIKIDVTHEDSEEYGFMQGLLHGKNKMMVPLYLKSGKNLICFKQVFKDGTHIYYVENKGETKDFSYEISPQNEVFFIDKPKKLRTFIKNYREKLLKIESENGDNIPFEYTVKDKTNGYTASMIDVYPDERSMEILGEGEHTLTYLLESGKALKQKILIKPNEKDTKLQFINFDVGQANATLIFLPNGKKLLIDSASARMAKDKIIPYLKEKSIKIDYFLLTHFHNDHDGMMDEIIEQNGIRPPDSKKAWMLIKKDAKKRYSYLKKFNYLDSTMLCCYDEIHSIWDLGEVKITATNSRYDEGGNPTKEYHYSFIRNNEHNFENSTSVSFMLEYNGFRYYHSADTYGISQDRYMADMIKMGKEDELSCHWFYANHHFVNDINAKFINTLNPVGVLVPNVHIYHRASYTHYYKENVVDYYFSHKRLKDTLVSGEIGNVRVCVDSGDKWYYEILQDENL